MNYIKIFALSLLMLFTVSSCDEALDINTNPLVASAADPNVVLPYVFVQYSNRHVTELGTRTMDVSQHFSACFNSPRGGNTSSFLTGNTWGMFYTQVLGNLQLVEADAAEAGPSANNINAIAKVLKALSFFELSSIWESVPFTEALDGATFPSPQFDDQETIFKGSVALLDEAISLIDAIPEGSVNVSSGDLVYEGDMSLWRRYANSLKIRILMMIRNKDTSVDGQLTAAFSQPVIDDNSQAAMIRYFDTPAESNAYNRLVEAFFGIGNETQGVYAPGEPLYNILAEAEDPRLRALIVDPDGNGSPGNGQFLPFGAGAGAVISENVIRNDIPHMLMLPSEINFYKAELTVKGVLSGDAQAAFDEGLGQIISWWGGQIPGARVGIAGGEIDAFIGSLPSLASLGQDAALEAIYEQLYLESFLRPIVAWNTVRRTKVPALDPPPGTGISTYLKRFAYPPNEVASNVNTPANQPNDTPQWFEN